MTAVATWRATNTTVISARLRCSARVAKRGSAPSDTRPQVAMPSAITPVRSTRETTPVPRMRYQRAIIGAAPAIRPRA